MEKLTLIGEEVQMKRTVNKWTLTCIALCSMGIGVARAATGWSATGTSANWDVAGNWNNGLPLADTKTQFSSNNETECIVASSVVAGQLVMGDGGDPAMTVKVRIVSGGTLTSGVLDTDDWSAVSYNRPV